MSAGDNILQDYLLSYPYMDLYTENYKSNIEIHFTISINFFRSISKFLFVIYDEYSR